MALPVPLASRSAPEFVDSTSVLETLRDALPAGTHYLSSPGLKLSAAMGVDLMVPTLDPEVGAPLITSVAHRLASGELPTSALTHPVVHGLLDRLLPLFSSYLHGNTALSTLGTCLYMHPTALASLSAVLASPVIPAYAPSAGPTGQHVPDFARPKDTNPPPADVVPLPGVSASEDSGLLPQCVYVACVGILRLAAVAHETIVPIAGGDEDTCTVCWLQGHLDLVWAMDSERVVHALLLTEARLVGLPASDVDSLGSSSGFSPSPVQALLTKGRAAAVDPVDPHALAVVHHLRLIRYLLVAYLRMLRSAAAPAMKPFRWGVTFDLPGMASALQVAHPLLALLKAAHDPALALAAPGVDQQYERILAAQQRGRFCPLPTFGESVSSLQAHCVNGTLLAALPAIASYGPHHGVAQLLGKAWDGAGAPKQRANPVVQQVGPPRPGDSKVNRRCTVPGEVVVGIGARMQARQLMCDVPFSGVTDLPLRWPDPLGASSVCLTRHHVQGATPPVLRPDGSLASPGLPAHAVHGTIPTPPDDTPDFRDYADTTAFDPKLVAAPRAHVSFHTLFLALEEWSARKPDPLSRAWAHGAVLAVPTEQNELAIPAELRATGYAFDDEGKLRRVSRRDAFGRPDGPGFEGFSDTEEWEARDLWRGAHVVSAVVFGTHTLFEVIAADMAEQGVPAELLWSREGRTFVLYVESVFRNYLAALCLYSRTRLRRKLPDDMRMIHGLAADAVYYDKMWSTYTDQWYKIFRFAAGRETVPGPCYTELTCPFGARSDGSAADAPPAATWKSSPVDNLPMDTFAELPDASAPLQAVLDRVASLPTACSDPNAFRTLRFPADARLRRLHQLLYTRAPVQRGPVVEDAACVMEIFSAWTMSYVCRLLYNHLGEGGAEGLFHPEEALAVQWWAESFTLSGHEMSLHLSRMRGVATAFPELAVLPAESLYCTLTGAVHSLLRQRDPFPLAVLEAVLVRATQVAGPNWGVPQEEVEEEEEIKIDTKAPSRSSGKGGKKGGKGASAPAPPVPASEEDVAKAFLQGIVVKDKAIAEALMQRNVALSVTLRAARGSVEDCVRGFRDTSAWVGLFFLHRASARILIVMDLLGLYKLLDVPQEDSTPEAGDTAAAPSGDAARGGTRRPVVPPGTLEAGRAGFSHEVATPPPTTYRDAGLLYTNRWREYAQLDRVSSFQDKPCLAHSLFTWAAYSARVRSVRVTQAATLPEGLGPEAVPILRQKLHLVSFYDNMEDAATWVARSGRALKESSRESALLTALGKAAGSKDAIAAAVVAVMGKTPAKEVLHAASARDMTGFEARLWAVVPTVLSPSAGELLWASTDEARSTRLKRIAAGHTILLAKLRKNEATLRRARAAAGVVSPDGSVAGEDVATKLVVEGGGEEPLLPVLKLPSDF